jgi:hypothetical protein
VLDTGKAAVVVAGPYDPAAPVASPRSS